MDSDDINNIHPAGTIVCILCKGVLSFSNNDKSLFYKHIEQHHNVHFHHNFVMAINFLDKDTMVRIEEEFEKSLTVEVSDDILMICDENEEPGDFDISQETITQSDEETLAIEWKGSNLNEVKENMEVCDKSVNVEKFSTLNNDKVESGSGILHCNKCVKTFKSSRVFDKHILLHSREIQFKCDMCSKSFSSKDDLRKHTKKYHKPVFDKMTKPFSCNKCGSFFTQDKNLKTHIKNKHRLFMDKTNCESKIELKYPVTTSEKCKICEKSISHPETLDKHLLSHNKEKMFSCEVCGNSFTQDINLKRHIENTHGLHSIDKKIVQTIKPLENSNQSIKPSSKNCDLVTQKSVFNSKLEGKTFTDQSLPKGFKVNEYSSDGQMRRRYLSPKGEIFNSRKSLVEHMRTVDTFTDKDIKKVMYGFVVS